MPTEKNIAPRSEIDQTLPVYTRREWPLVGSLFDFMGNGGIDFLLSIAQQSDVSRFHLGTIPIMLFNTAEHAQSVLVEHGYDCTKGRLMHAAFGAGPRICIGNYLALMESQLLIATLVQRVAFTLLARQTVKPDIRHNLALRPGGELKVMVKQR
ncbi:MAG TPA: cytochrome P450 [Ktedonobacteraceae bacterium]|nr:cytochrome P450 [Ktedonobacteraceae bacterium]